MLLPRALPFNLRGRNVDLCCSEIPNQASHSLTVNGNQAIFTNTAIVRGQGVWLAHTLMLEC